MTRALSELLDAPEPSFRLGLRQLEKANGNPSHDVRLTAEMLHMTQDKVRELGLDPHDTTGEELYEALQERVKADDKRLEKALRTRAATFISAEADLTAGLVHTLQGIPEVKDCFALKATVLKTLLKKQPPKRAMKQLCYRSLDSMLKHEPPACSLAAAYLSESLAWRRSFNDLYKGLKASDFETRPVSISSPNSARWQALAQGVVVDKQHTVISLRELGAIILLPLPEPEDRPEATVVASLALAVHELNEIQASSTFLRLAQVRANFGASVQIVTTSEPQLQTELLDQPVPWQMLQRFYTGIKETAKDDLFEPYLQLEDFSWHAVENILSEIAPSLEFWQNTASLGLLDKGQAVSLNVLDNALSCCNQLSYTERQLKSQQQALMAELSLRYLKHETLSQAILGELQPQLATEKATV